MDKLHRKQTPLHRAIIKRKTKTVSKQILQGASVHAQDSKGNTPLHLAAKSGDTDIVKLLLKIDGINVSAKNDLKETPLHIAVNSKNLNVVQLLLEEDIINVNAKDFEFSTPLHLATYLDDADILKCLLQAGANVNAVGGLQETPLWGAIRNEKLDNVKLLVEAGANVNAKDTFGYSSLCQIIFRSENLHIMKVLLKAGADLHSVDLNNKTPLTTLLDKIDSTINRNRKIKSLECLELVLNYMDVNLTGKNGKNILTDVLKSRPSSFNQRKSPYNIILQYIAKLKALDYELDSNLVDFISRNTCFNNYFLECSRELEKAKTSKLHNCWVTFFNLLIDDKFKLVKYAGNQNLIQDFHKRVLQNFPIYESAIQKNVSEGIDRRKFYDGAANNLSYFMPIFDSTHLIIKDILDTLSKKDWKQLAERKRFYNE